MRVVVDTIKLAELQGKATMAEVAFKTAEMRAEWLREEADDANRRLNNYLQTCPQVSAPEVKDI